MKKVAIIGHFGGSENLLDGQTVKTKILYEELSAHTDWDIKIIDTYYRKTKPFKLLINTLVTLVSTKDIMVLLSGNGMRFYFPLLWLASKIYDTRVYHDVIGGNLDSYIKRYPKFERYLNSFEVNWVETNLLKNRVEACGVTNCEVLPNFKRLNIIPEDEICREDFKSFNFCTFSRVTKEKGIEDAIAAIEAINAEAGETRCSLDIYGVVDNKYKDQFAELMNKVTPCIQYKGSVPFNKSVETIKDYYALLFPTYWDGEGFPGTIVDAYSAGLPVIATDWNSNSELVVNGETGVLYPNENFDNLKSAILWMINHQELWIEMRRNCIRYAKKYQPDEYVKIIVEKIS